MNASPIPVLKNILKKVLSELTVGLIAVLQAGIIPSKHSFGIIQGSTHDQYRNQCVREVTKRDLPGYAIGGVSVGEGPELMREIVAHTAPQMPKDKPRYVMGVGNPEDLLDILGTRELICLIVLFPQSLPVGELYLLSRVKFVLSTEITAEIFFPLIPILIAMPIIIILAPISNIFLILTKSWDRFLRLNIILPFIKPWQKKHEPLYWMIAFAILKKKFLNNYK